MNIDRDRAAAAFKDYVAAYNPEDPKIELKISHTWRVADLCDRIARSLLKGPSGPVAGEPVTDETTAAASITQEDVDLAWLLGLLHDIGRFEQVQRFGTFNDAQSVSHAALGAQILFSEGGEGAGGQSACAGDTAQEPLGEHVADGGGTAAEPLIRAFVQDPAEDELIRTAVSLHSAWHLPEGLDARTRCFCDILRDADKVDILKVNCVNTVESIYGFPEQTLLDSQLSSDAASWFWRHSTIPREARHYPADILLGHICFVWELVYPESLRAAVEQGYVFQMLERPFTRPDTRAAFARMEAHLKEQLEKRGLVL